MKDTINGCEHCTVAEDVIYKDVVVIGNGPSGLVTSFMLAGNVPYLKEIPADLPIDEMLRARLSNIPAGKSLYDVDLMELAEGLEGRSQNPISILMDILMRPCTDMGLSADSLIEWKYEADKEVDHVVLGREGVGGVWSRLGGGAGAVRTLSPRGWLALPPHTRALAHSRRVPADALAAYFRRYVHECKLQRFIRCNVVVSRVSRVRCAASPRGGRHARYLVQGYCAVSGRAVRYECARVVAGAGNARARRLAPRLAPHALHALPDVLRALPRAPQGSVALVVGGGAGAADAVLSALAAGLSVAHAHRDPAPALAALDRTLYPDYHQVYKMMTDGDTVDYPNYKSYPHHMIVDITPEKSGGDELTPKRVRMIDLNSNNVVEITVTFVAVLIGSKPDLSFLRTNFTLDCVESNCKCEQLKKDQCFFRNHWHYLKTVIQGLRICKSRYLTEINGNDTKRRNSENLCNNLISKLENGVVKSSVEESCECGDGCLWEQENPYSSGMGYGLDPTKPVDSKNPIAIDRSTHQLLHCPGGIYALGPLTGDNFIRFIPGGALAIVADIHKSPVDLAN